MIKLNFKIISFYYKNKQSYRQKYIECKVSKYYSNIIKLRDVLVELYEKYGINNKNELLNYFVPDLNELLWGQYFSEELCKKIRCWNCDFENLTLEELERQFKISDIEIVVYLNRDGIGDTVGESEGIIFKFHTNEKDLHHIPHIHCTYSGIETRINLETLEVLDKPFKKSKMKVAIDLVKKNQKDLLNYWNTVVINGEKIKFKMEI